MSEISVKTSELQRILSRLQSEEISALYELVHLGDNVKTYAKAKGLSLDFEIIDRFRAYRIASNFVNIHKHGVRGRNAKTARIDYYYYIGQQVGKTPSPEGDPILEVLSVINFDGAIYTTKELITDLIKIWEMFLRYHTEIDVSSLNKKLKPIIVQLQDLATYSAPVPDDVIEDAKKQATERKLLDIQ